MFQKQIALLKSIPQKVLDSPLFNTFLSWSKRTSFPGFFSVPVYDVAIFLYNEVTKFAISTRANAIAFSFFISLFPTLIVLITVIGYLPDNYNYVGQIKIYIDDVFPGGAGNTLKQVIDEVRRPNGGLLSIGFLLAIFFSSNGMMEMMNGFDKSYEKTFKQRSPIRQRLIAIALTFQLGLLLLVSSVLIIIGSKGLQWIFGMIQLSNFEQFGLSVLQWVVILGMFYTGISLLYRFGAATHKKIAFFSPGATLATLLSILTSLGFSIYVDNFQTYSKLYGAIGSIIVLMLWIQFNSLILLIGFELNASIAVNRDIKESVE